MLTGFYVFHKKHPNGLEKLPHGVDLYAFKTCFRHIYFAHDATESLSLDVDFEVYQDQKAYQFVMEVLCGLHSPVVGETEVFGQFKNFWQTTLFPYALKQIFSSMLTDVKRIRGQHLVDLGGQSYGSLIRKLLSSYGRTPIEVAVVGAGAFVQDILPWIYKDENRVEIFARDTVKAQKEFNAFKRVEVKDIALEKALTSVAIIAAPVTAKQIEALIPSKDTFVIDLRGESREDACTQFSNYKDLNCFFDKIQENQSQIVKAKSLALEAIEQISHKRFFTENPRPFGWEDICVW